MKLLSGPLWDFGLNKDIFVFYLSLYLPVVFLLLFFFVIIAANECKTEAVRAGGSVRADEKQKENKEKHGAPSFVLRFSHVVKSL